MAWTTPGTATAGEVLTAAFWNTNVRDNSSFLFTPPMVKVYRSSNQTSYTSQASISWQAEEYDTDAMWTSGTDVTIKTAGIYLISFYAFASGAATITSVFAGVRKNGTYLGQQNFAPYTTTATSCTYSNTHKLAVSDVITADVQFLGGSAYVVSGAATDANAQSRLIITWIGKD
jgi:hypothetical protein